MENVRLQRIQAGGVFQVCVQTIFHLLTHDDGAHQGQRDLRIISRLTKTRFYKQQE